MTEKLSAFTNDTNNNLSLIRITLALLVLLSHSFAMVSGDATTQPFYGALKMTPGTMAVDMFFVISGFLLTQSLLKKNDPIDFIIARAARIYPALICATLFTALIIGTAFTCLPISEYLANADTAKYIIKTATIVRGIEFTLPEVFKNIPLYDQVNGSLWSLPFELKMYGLIFILWLIAYKTSSQRYLVCGVLVTTIASGFIYCYTTITQGVDLKLPRLIYFFFSGSLLYCAQSIIPASRKWLWIAIALLATTVINQTSFLLAWTICAPYILIYIAFIPKSKLLVYNKLGDYSYGVYVFAWPIQQSIVQIDKYVSTLQLIWLSAILTILIAIPCFHYIEAPSMRKRRSVVNWIKCHSLFQKA